MVAAKDKSHAETHLIQTSVKSIPDVVRSAVLYGPNAAGKSNLIHALTFMRDLVATSATHVVEGQRLNYQPFKLIKKSANAPSEFELTFLIDGIRYQYGFTSTDERIFEEWLLVYKSAKAQQWFRRRFDLTSGKDKYEFSTHLTGRKKLWEQATRGNGLFLSTATQLNSELLRPVFLWITQNLSIFGANRSPVLDSTFAMIQDAEDKSAVLRFLEAADLNIVDVSLEVRKVQELGFEIKQGESPSSSIKETERPFVHFFHESDDGVKRFEIHEESAGTIKLFSFAGPILNVLRGGGILVVDELDGSLHHLMVRYLVKLFHSELNKLGAQLILTTHDTALLDNSLLRRDQIWFLEKDRTQATKLYPLTEFSPRKNEALERGYLDGRYGGLPFLSAFDIR